VKQQSVLHVTYATWKASFKRVPSFYVPQGDSGYHLFNVGDSVVIQTAVAGDSEDCSDFETNYKAHCTEAASPADAFVLGYVATSSPFITPRAPRGVALTQVAAREGSKVQVISQNFCDKHTWYSTSVRRNAQPLSDTGDGLTWALAVDVLGVDVTHGRILHERRLRGEYAPVVTVDGVVVAEKDPHDDEGDYVIDYVTMRVTFATSQASKTITLSFNEVVDSSWYVRPLPGKTLRLLKAELNFSRDVRMRDTFVFKPRADVSKFPPLFGLWDQNPAGPPGPYPAGTMIPVGDAVYYQTQRDLVCEANLAYPCVTKTAGDNLTWRDLTDDMLVYSWDYADQASVDLTDRLGLDIEISLEHHVPCDGTAAVVTFYCLSEDDPE
jgi:hypothetical protein